MSDWPEVVRTTQPWRTNPDQRGPNGTRPNRADRELREVVAEVPQPIASRPVPLTPDVAASCEHAARQITQLEGRAQHLSGIGELLARTEAVASSKVERIYADLDEMARAAVGENTSESARRTFAAITALRSITDSVSPGQPLREAAILEAHLRLLGDERTEGRDAGKYRVQQNWIGGSNYSPRNAVHVPPPPADVPKLMADLIEFANRDDIGGIGQAAIVHAQFEAIHPFTDGNGRIGRALIGASLRRRGLTSVTSVPVAAAVLADVDTYFARLRDYREGNVDSLVQYVSTSAATAADAAGISADRLAELPGEWNDLVPARKGSSTHALKGALLREPILDIARAEAITGSTRIRTYEAIDKLAEAGVLDEITGGGRNRIWVAADVMAELSDLEERIGRRSRPAAYWPAADNQP